MQPLRNIVIGGLLALQLLHPARADSIAEGFDHNRNEGILIYGRDGERIFRSMSSKFAWGAFSAGDGEITAIIHNTTTALRFNGSAWTPGSYVYTRFDADTVQASGGMANKPSRRIDLSGPTAELIVSLMYSGEPAKGAFLLRDKARWWRSSAFSLPAHDPDYNEERRIVLKPSELEWIRLEGTGEMDEVDDGDSQSLRPGAPGNPDLGAIEGMGFMAMNKASTGHIDISGLSLTDGNRPQADLSEPMKQSDVAFLHKPTPLEKFDEYGGAKVVYWDQGWVPEQVALTLDYGVRDMPGVSFGVVQNTVAQEDPKTKAAIAKDLWGNEILEGNESFPTGMQARLCMRQPGFTGYVRNYIREHVFECGAREALIDEPMGYNGQRSAFRTDAGCFCDLCTSQFTEWLKSHYRPEELAGMGIEDIAAFDYRERLRSIVGEEDLSAYRQLFDQGKLPMMDDFIRFQQSIAREFFKMMLEYAKSLDPAFVFTPNTFNLRPEVLFLTEEANADFHGAESELYLYNFDYFPVSLLRLRLADGLGIRMVTSGVFWEFRHAREQNLVEIFKLIIPAIYASGHLLAVPDQYRWTEPDYFASMPDLAPFYRFIRQNARLFDDYEPITQVGIIYDNSVASQYTGDPVFQKDYADIGTALVRNNVLFGVAAGADGIYYRREFDLEELEARFEQVILPRNTQFDGVQEDALAAMRKAGRLHDWNDAGSGEFLPKIRSWVSCNLDKVLVLPRRKGVAPDAPVVVHVVNMDYIPDRVNPRTGVVIRLSPEIAAGKVEKIIGHSPHHASWEVSFSVDQEGVEIILPDLHYWNVLELVPVK